MENASHSRARSIVHAAIAIAIVAAGIIGVNALFSTAPQIQSRQRPPRRAALVEVTNARSAPHELMLRASGLVSPARRIDVVPQVRGRVVSVHKDLVPGRVVKRGEALIAIERSDYQLAVQRAESALAQARASLSLELGNQQLAALEAEYLDDLVTEDNQELVLRKPQLATARAQLAAAQADLDQARLNLSRTRVTAPFDAVVVARDVATGKTVTEQTPIATLAGVAEWWVRVEVPVSYLSQLAASPSQRAVISFPAWGDRQREGAVIESGAQVEERGRLGSVLVSVPDPMALSTPDAPRMLLNMRVDVQLSGNTIPGAVVVPPAWVHNEREVWIMNERDQLDRRAVDIVYRDARQVVIASGIADGERIVTSSLASPVDGMKLRLAGGEPRDDRARPAVDERRGPRR